MRQHNIWDKHVLTIIESPETTIYQWAEPGTKIHSITYINSCGIMAVTGDFGNWIFSRPFGIGRHSGVSDSYWSEKLRNSSQQTSSQYDEDETRKYIQNLLDDPDEELTEEEKSYLVDLLDYADNELDFTYQAYRYNVGRFEDAENIPLCKKTHVWLDFVYDGFDAMVAYAKKHKLAGFAEPVTA